MTDSIPQKRRPIRTPAPDGFKHCTGCDRDLLATPEYFGSDKRKKDGYRQPCKECRRTQGKQERQDNHEKCLEKERVYRVRNHENILQSSRKYEQKTRGKRKDYHRQYQQTHREMYRQISRRYYRSHHEQCIEGMKQYRKTHREEMRAWNRAYYRSHPEIDKGRYLRTHPEKRREHQVNREARKKTIPGIHTSKQIQELLKRQRYHCYYCKGKFERRKGRYVYHIDHTFPLSREGARNDISHLVLACPSCNLKKNNKYPWEWPEGGRLL